MPDFDGSFKTEAKIAALSDVHGQYDVTIKLLQENKIIDKENNWAWGDGHLVIVGDVFDRGDQVTEILWLVHKLERQAEDAGGKVHLLLGNHEIMVLTGDLRYLHKKYRYTMAVFKRPLDSLLHKDTYLGAWLRTKPIAISINDMAFVHGGFSELLLEHLPNLEAINEAGHLALEASTEERDKNALMDFYRLPMLALEATEKLECLRYLEYGKKIKMVETHVTGVEIDTPEDLEHAKRLWK